MPCQFGIETYVALMKIQTNILTVRITVKRGGQFFQNVILSLLLSLIVIKDIVINTNIM